MAKTNNLHLANLFVLDLNGVVTNPESGAVNQQVLAAVAEELKRGATVAFNTGRALPG